MKGAAPRRRTPPLPAKPVERPGLAANKQIRHELLRRLHQGDVKFARRLTHSRTVIVLDYADQEVSFVYSKSTKEILRFLAADAPETETWRSARAGGGISCVAVPLVADQEPEEAVL